MNDVFSAIPDDRRAAAIAAIASVADPASVTRISPTAPGASGGSTLRVDAGSSTYLLRLEPGRRGFHDPNRSFPRLRTAAAACIAPRVHHADEESVVVLMDFVLECPLTASPSPHVASTQDSDDDADRPNSRVLGPTQFPWRRRCCVPSSAWLLPPSASHQRSCSARRAIGENHDSGLPSAGCIELGHRCANESSSPRRASRRDHHHRRRAHSRERTTLPSARTRPIGNLIRRRPWCCQHCDLCVVDRHAVHRGTGVGAGLVFPSRPRAQGHDAGHVCHCRPDDTVRFTPQGPRAACVLDLGVSVPGRHKLFRPPDVAH
jgi:hypothetical protein